MSGVFTAIAGVVISGVGLGMSIDQYNQAQDAKIKAETEAEAKMEEAMKRLDINYMESLAVPMEAYERQSEEMLQVSANVLEAAKEGDQRGVAPTAGRVLAAHQSMTDTQRGELEKTIFNLDAAVAEEESRLRDIKTQINLSESAGAQQAAAREGEIAAMAKANAITQGGNVAAGAINAVGLYQGDTAVKTQMTDNPKFQTEVAAKYDPTGTKGIATMSDLQFRDYMTTNFSNKEIRNMFPTTNTQTSDATISGGNTIASVDATGTGSTIASGGKGSTIASGGTEPMAQWKDNWKNERNPFTFAPYKSFDEYVKVQARAVGLSVEEYIQGENKYYRYEGY
jgi:hypothetical protein